MTSDRNAKRRQRRRSAREEGVEERDVLFSGGDLDNSEDEDETFAFSAIREMAEGGIRRPPGGAGELYVVMRVTEGSEVREERIPLDLPADGKGRFADAVGSAVARIAREKYAQGLAPRLVRVVRGRPARPATEVEPAPAPEPAAEPEDADEDEEEAPLPAPAPLPEPEDEEDDGGFFSRVGATVDGALSAVTGAIGRAASAVASFFGFGRR